jgi:hypothetical protein
VYRELSKKEKKEHLILHKGRVIYEGPNKISFYARNIQIIIIVIKIIT